MRRFIKPFSVEPPGELATPPEPMQIKPLPYTIIPDKMNFLPAAGKKERFRTVPREGKKNAVRMFAGRGTKYEKNPEILYFELAFRQWPTILKSVADKKPQFDAAPWCNGSTSDSGSFS